MAHRQRDDLLALAVEVRIGHGNRMPWLQAPKRRLLARRSGSPCEFGGYCRQTVEFGAAGDRL
jgi:hypothetical protein